jgi:hypothetical protein
LELPERARLRELERRTSELEMEDAFLENAAAYFANEQWWYRRWLPAASARLVRRPHRRDSASVEYDLRRTGPTVLHAPADALVTPVVHAELPRRAGTRRLTPDRPGHLGVAAGCRLPVGVAVPACASVRWDRGRSARHAVVTDDVTPAIQGGGKELPFVQDGHLTVGDTRAPGSTRYPCVRSSRGRMADSDITRDVRPRGFDEHHR